MLAYYRSQEVMPAHSEILCPECDSANLRLVKTLERKDEYYVCRECHYEFIMYTYSR